jgi:hypothetical protein
VSAGAPRYDPKKVAELARNGRVVASMRVTSWLLNHDYDAAETLVEVLGSIEKSGEWLGSCTLKNSEIADEYTVWLDGEEWYLKFYIDEEQVVVNVWSCWWQGAAH